MATVHHSLPPPRFSAIPSLAIVPAASICRRSIGLPIFKGLKSAPIPSFRASGLVSAMNSRSGRRCFGDVVCAARDTAIEVPAISEATWKSLVLESDTAVLVEFWAPWCGPCRMIHPLIDELSKQYAGKLKCYKVNTDESSSIATRYGIRSIPTVIIFKNGEKKDAVVGAVPKSTLTASIDKFL